MAIDSADYISELTEGIPLNADARGEGAAQIRSVKRAVKQSFPNIDGEVTATTAEMNNVFNNVFLIPGMIMMWSKSSGALPTGWFPCDGANYESATFGPTFTPDLRDRFIKSAVSQGDISETTQGEKTNVVSNASVTVGGHTLTESEMPSHQHATSWGERPDSGQGKYGIKQSDGSNNLGSGDSDNDNQNYLSEPIGGDQAHDHAATLETITFGNEPEHVTMLFIIFVGADGVETSAAPPYVPTPDVPVASFTNTEAGLVVTFTDTSTDPSGTLNQWSWVFGDGNVSSAQNPQHTYAAAGTYAVRLVVTSNTGLEGSTTQYVTVTP